ncbi:hypothetical protein [Robertkochia aurantiaca]|uniref:hypothetical protein n=1 Tax=Robertkochia aurantiaca TaxID=2873700 RepID=UPI001CCD6B1C|nr:hypothetical protein [Robertkochia sp. 3YJGBD-33]
MKNGYYFIGILIVIVILLYIYLERSIEKTIGESLLNQNEISTKIDFKDLKFNLLRRNLEIQTLQIQQKINNTDSVNITVPELVIQNISPDALQDITQLDIKTVSIQSPDISLYRIIDSTLQDSSSQIESPKLQMISIELFNIENGNVKLFIQDSLRGSLALKSLRIHDLKHDLLSDKIPSFKSTTSTLTNIDIHLDPFHNLQIQKCRFDGRDLSIEKLKYYNIFDQDKFQSMIDYETDWINVSVDKIMFKELEFRELLKQNVKTEELNISNPIAIIYKNKRIPHLNKYKPILTKTLTTLDNRLQIDTTIVSNASITYLEQTAIEGSKGKLTLDKSNIFFAPINNHTKQPVMVKANLFLSGNTPINTTMKIYMDRTNGEFHMTGSVTQLNADDLNPFVYPSQNVRTFGFIKDMYFTIEGNDERATGNFKMDYSDFRVELKKQDQKSNRKFLTGLANLFITNNKSSAKEVSIKQERDQSRSIFNFLWRCILNGMLHTLL